MTVTYVTTVISGAGPLFTYAANSDSLVILSTGALLATSGTAISTAFDNVNLHLFGTVASVSTINFSGNNALIHIYEGGSITSLVQSYSGIGIDLWSGGNLINEGSISTDRATAIVMRAGTSVTNAGSITGVNGAFVGLNGLGDVHFVNSGTVSATAYDDAFQGARYNNGLVVEGLNAHVINTATGLITAISSEGAGIYVSDLAGGSSIRNYGEIHSLQSVGVDLRGLGIGQSLVSVENWGTISGLVGAVHGSANADSLVNHGLLIGNVDMGDGADRFINSGSVEGDVHLGSDFDVYDGSLGTASGTVYGDGDNDTFFVGAGVDSYDGGSGADYLDFGKTGATQMALDDSIDFSGSSAGDTYTGFEHVYGSAFDDVIYGSAGANLLVGRAGNDTINGGAGGDTLRGGTGIDALTGGLGNDRFQYLALADCGDTITDFHNVAGDDDAFYISAAKFGGGLVAGTLAASQFRSRADNAAQDADDRFIFRTTDQTLWYDADGNGAGVAIMVADLNADASLSNLDIVII